MNIHMFCGGRPGLLLATMKALDNLGLDVQQAVISCLNGFALDVFRAEVRLLNIIYFQLNCLDSCKILVVTCFVFVCVYYQQCQEGQEILPDQIKAVLFDTAGYAGMI